MRLLTALLVEMDGLEASHGVVVLAATNRPCTTEQCTIVTINRTTGALDTALLRPGRFDVQVYVPPPDRAGRVDILRVACRSVPLASDVDFESLAVRTEHMTGRWAPLRGGVQHGLYVQARNWWRWSGSRPWRRCEKTCRCEFVVHAATINPAKQGCMVVHARHFDAALHGLQASVQPGVLARYHSWAGGVAF